MSRFTPARPAPDEHIPYYAQYIALVPDGDITQVLIDQAAETRLLLRSLSEAGAGSRPAADHWTVRQIIGHLLDTERVLAYRALRFARGDATALPGFEPPDYALSGAFEARSFPDLAHEYEGVSQASVALFGSLDEAAWLRRGLASGAEVSVRALAHIIAGHERSHWPALRTPPDRAGPAG
jgi:hypothetical protein